MDGFCVNSSDYPKGIEEGLPIQSVIAAGDKHTDTLLPGHAVQIMTGGVAPKNGDMVIKIEECKIDEQKVYFQAGEFFPWLNIARRGEDAKQGGCLIARNTKITPAVGAVATSVGVTKINVYRKPVVSVVSTGNEVVPCDQTPQPWQIRNCNDYSCTMTCRKLGAAVENRLLVSDDKKMMHNELDKAENSDIVLLTGGVSAGDFDFVPAVLSEKGVKLIFHKIKIRPGKPIWFGKDSKGRAFFGLPGNPVSVQVNLKLFVEPYIRACSGASLPSPQFIPFKIDRPITKNFPLEWFFPIKIVDAEKRLIRPYKTNTSGDFVNFGQSDGIGRMDLDRNTYDVEDEIPVLLWD